MSRLKLVDSLKGRQWAGHVAVGQIPVNGQKIGCDAYARICRNCLDFRSEDKCPSGLCIAERLLAQAVPRSEEAAFPGIPKRKGEHAAHLL